MREAWKLFKLRKNGTLGPLFINARQVVPVGEWLKAEAHRTNGFAFRPGWHCCAEPNAPHLGKRGRVWCRVQIEGITEHHRPEAQGGLWFTAERLRVVEVGIDPHRLKAAEYFGVPYSKVTKEQRASGKALNFAVMYV